MVNPVLVLTHNTLELTKRCIQSILAQDVPVSVFVIDNGSTDGTREWLSSDEWMASDGYVVMWQRFDPQIGVSKGWNTGIERVFGDQTMGGANRAFVVNSDTVLPPYFCRRLLSIDFPFLTGTSVGTMEEIAVEPPVRDLVEAPDFSAFCISREAWEKVGKFDADMFLYASDLDYHLRSWMKGFHIFNTGIPFYHERSSTLNTASPKDKRWIELRADADRAAFHKKWGFHTCSPEYASMFKTDLFGMEDE